jgi:hypothetical protein
MSWHFLPELAGASWGLTSSDGEPWRRSRKKLTDGKYSCGDKGTVCSPCSRFGTTPRHSMDGHSVESWTSLPPGFLASLSRSQGKTPERTTPGTAGRPPSESFGKWDHASRSWRTSQASLLTNTLEPYSGNWPRAGMTRSGTVFQLPPLAPLTRGTGSGFWPTPRREDGQSAGAHNGVPDTMTAATGEDLATVVARGGTSTPQNFPTPKARDGKGQTQRGVHRQADGLPNLDRGDGKPLGGQLNPSWVEWLMGWPIGWTDLRPLETARFLLWSSAHGHI